MKSPAFQFYPQDFISSLDVQIMSAKEVGAYCLLLFNSWVQEQQGYLPNDEKLLQKICRLTDAEWAESGQLLMRKFEKSGDKIYNKRLVSELDKQANFRAKQAKNGQKGGRPRLTENPKKPTAFFGETQTKPKKSSSFSSSSSSSSSDEEKEIPRKEVNVCFSEFWDTYGKKTGDRAKCERKWNALSDFERTTIIAGLPVFVQNITDKQFQPYPETFLNQRRWLDEGYGEARQVKIGCRLPDDDYKKYPDSTKLIMEGSLRWDSVKNTFLPTEEYLQRTAQVSRQA